MNRGLAIGVVAGLVFACGAPLALRAGEPTAAVSAEKEVDRLAPLARLIGEWRVEGAWTSGDKLRARAIYSWGIGKKFIDGATFVIDNDTGKEYQRYDAVMGWHPEKRSLFQTSYAYDGSIGSGLFDASTKGVIRIGYTPFEGTEEPKIRQDLTFKGEEVFTWHVMMKNAQGGWDTLIEADWKRVK